MKQIMSCSHSSLFLVFLGILLLLGPQAAAQSPGGAPTPPPPLQEVFLHLPPAGVDAEASGLTPILDPAFLAPGWSMGFWVILDEPPVEQAIARLGRRSAPGGADQGWEVQHVTARTGAQESGVTADGEAIVRRGDWVYIFGSHFGKKKGPLDEKRQFVARFKDPAPGSAATATASPPNPPEIILETAVDHFLLHRIINDAFIAHQVDLIARGPDEYEKYIKKMLKGKKAEAPLVQRDDRALNIEGAAFLDSGVLLLGLRYPVTRQGHPILVAIRDIDLLFSGGRPVVEGFWVLENVGDVAQPTGIRDLFRQGSRIDVLTGNLDRFSNKKGESEVLDDHPEGWRALSAHYRFSWPPPADASSSSNAPSSVRALQAELIRSLAPLHNAEGLASDPQGNFYYVFDEKRVHLQYESGTR